MTPREIADKYFVASMGFDAFTEMQADIAALVKREVKRDRRRRVSRKAQP